MNYDFVNNPDPKIIAFQKALGQKESGNTPSPGATQITKTEGSIGRFQYLPETFSTYAKKYFGGVNPLTGKPLNVGDDLDQKLVNYAYVKEKMDQGYSPYDVAASWNAGEGRINSWQDMKGINKYGNKYDVPAYADEVVHNYRENMRQIDNPNYSVRTFDPTRDSAEAYAVDQDVASQLREKEVQREKDLQAYIDKDPLIPFLDPVTDWAADFSEGIIKDATGYVGKAATTANEYLGFSDNPMLREGTASNKQFTELAQESDNTAQTLGSATGSLIRTAAEIYAGNKLASVALGSLSAGSAGVGVQKALLGQGLTKTLARAGVSTAGQMIPFAIDEFLQGGDWKNLTLPVAITMIAEGIIDKYKVGKFGSILEKVGALKAAGKFEEAEKLIASPEFAGQLARQGISTSDDLAKAAEAELPKIRTAVQEIVPTTSAVKVGEMSDEALKQVAANFTKTLDSNGNFNTVDDILRIRKASGELMNEADGLANKVSEYLNTVGKNVDLFKFKKNILADIDRLVAERSLLADDGAKFKGFVERNLSTTPSKAGAFADLHKLRKQLNLDFTHSNYDASRFLGDKIRNFVKGLGDSVEMTAYKNANKVYGDLQDAEYVLAKLNKKGSNISKSAISSLTGILASGGGFAPVQYFLGQRMGTFLADTMKKTFTPRLVGNKFSRLGTNPIVEARKMISEATKLSEKRITEVKGEINAQTLKDLKHTLFNAKTPEDIMKARKLFKQLAENGSVPNLDAFADYIKKQSSKIKTREELKEFLGTPQEWNEATKVIQMGQPGVSKFKKVDPNLPTAIDEAPQVFSKTPGTPGYEPYTPPTELPTIQAGEAGQSKFAKVNPTLPAAEGAPKVFSNAEVSEKYVADKELPVIDFGTNGKQVVNKIKQKMIDSGANLPTILSAVFGIGVLSTATPDQASAMAEESHTLNWIQQLLASDPVEAEPLQIEPAPKEEIKPVVEEKPGIIGGYDITSYATNPEHETNIRKMYNGIIAKKRDFTTPEGIDVVIKENAPKSKITGKMILKSAKKYDVDPKMLFCIMMEDSQLGTTGMGARNNNPGNVGQFDKLKKKVRGYKTLQAGVDAVAEILKTHKLD